MLVRDGETVVIGGLLDRQRQRTRQQIPLLGDIPVLGLLFGRNVWTDIDAELVILITPRIVEPGSTLAGMERVREEYEGVSKQLQEQEQEAAESARETGRRGSIRRWFRSRKRDDLLLTE